MECTTIYKVTWTQQYINTLEIYPVNLIGGGFGGKDTRNCMFSTALAVAANKYVLLGSHRSKIIRNFA